MIFLRLDHRLQGRIDPSDVIQESYLEASTRLAEYLRDPSMPFFLWLRFLTDQKLVTLHRHHLGVKMRDAGQEVALGRRSYQKRQSAALAAQVVGRRILQPSEAAIRAEMKMRVQEALNRMPTLERQVLALRHFEQLGRAVARFSAFPRPPPESAIFALERLEPVSRTVPAVWKGSSRQRSVLGIRPGR